MILFLYSTLGKKNGEKHYLYLSSALVQFPFSVWCCSSKPPAQLSLHPVPPLLLPLVGQEPSFPFDYSSTSPFLHITHLFIYCYATSGLDYIFCTIFTLSMASVVFPNNFILRHFCCCVLPIRRKSQPWANEKCWVCVTGGDDGVRGPWAQATVC